MIHNNKFWLKQKRKKCFQYSSTNVCRLATEQEYQVLGNIFLCKDRKSCHFLINCTKLGYNQNNMPENNQQATSETLASVATAITIANLMLHNDGVNQDVAITRTYVMQDLFYKTIFFYKGAFKIEGVIHKDFRRMAKKKFANGVLQEMSDEDANKYLDHVWSIVTVSKNINTWANCKRSNTYQASQFRFEGNFKATSTMTETALCTNLICVQSSVLIVVSTIVFYHR